MPPGALMFVLCVLHSKDKRHSQDKEVVDMKYRERIPVDTRFFARVQTGYWTHLASQTVSTGSLSRRKNGRDVAPNYSPPSSAEVKERVEL
jgi:hypothetical protein